MPLDVIFRGISAAPQFFHIEDNDISEILIGYYELGEYESPVPTEMREVFRLGHINDMYFDTVKTLDWIAEKNGSLCLSCGSLCEKRTCSEKILGSVYYENMLMISDNGEFSVVIPNIYCKACYDFVRNKSLKYEQLYSKKESEDMAILELMTKNSFNKRFQDSCKNKKKTSPVRIESHA